MSNEQTQTSVWIRLYRFAKETRKAQNAYFKDKTTTNLIVARECEKSLDDCIKEVEVLASFKGIEL